MLVEQLVKDRERLNIFNNALSSLYTIGMLSVLLEIAAKRSSATPSDKPIESAALRASWHDGYAEAVYDLFEFQERYSKVQPLNPQEADFGASLELLKSNEITKDEYERITGKPAPTF